MKPGTLAPHGEPEPILRATVRVLLIDDAERVLLFVSHSDSGEPFWFPPGGGIEAGETAEEARAPARARCRPRGRSRAPRSLPR